MQEQNTLTRRRLLAQAGTGALAGAIMTQNAGAQQQTPQARPTEPATKPTPQPALPPERRVGWAILGLGNFATQQIMPSFSDCKKSRMTGLVSGDLDKARRFASEYGVAAGSVYTYETLASLKDNPAIDVVYVITPNSTHHRFVLAALAAGKHVLCEKPMAPSVKECEEMIAAANRAGKKLMIAYRAQYEPFNLEAIRVCRSGELGRLVTITADHGRQADPSKKEDVWRLQKQLSGGGSLVDIGIYSLNATRYLTGEEPTEVQAWQYSPPNDPRFKEVEATMHWTLRFPSGTLANCSSSYDWQDTKRFRVQGAKGWLELDPATDYYRHRMRLGKASPTDPETTVISEPQIQEQNQFALEIDHFSECIQENKTPKTPGEEGLRDVRYMQAIYESARTGKSVKL